MDANYTVNDYGGGYHAWDVAKENYTPFQKVSNSLHF